MPKKTIVCEYEGSRIIVENTWLSGAKLFNNDELIASNNNLFAVNKDSPLMSAKIVLNEVEHLVEVFVYAVMTVKIQIKVNGLYIAGDKF